MGIGSGGLLFLREIPIVWSCFVLRTMEKNNRFYCWVKYTSVVFPPMCSRSWHVSKPMLYIPRIIYLPHIHQLPSACPGNILRYSLTEKRFHCCFDGIHGISSPSDSCR